MKKYILTLLISFPLLADYSSHLEAESVIKELTEEHGFDKSYVLKILSNALVNISIPVPYNAELLFAPKSTSL